MNFGSYLSHFQKKKKEREKKKIVFACFIFLKKEKEKKEAFINVFGIMWNSTTDLSKAALCI